MLRNATFVASESISADSPRVALFSTILRRHFPQPGHKIFCLTVIVLVIESGKLHRFRYFLFEDVNNSCLADCTIPSWAWHRSSSRAAESQLRTSHHQPLAGNTRSSHRRHQQLLIHKDLDQKPGNLSTMKWQVRTLLRLQLYHISPRYGAKNAPSLRILGTFP